MIIAINFSEKHKYPKLMREMFQLRAEVFHERLGWDVTVTDGLEIDRFDLAEPLYLLAVDEFGTLHGSLRLLPTTGPNMLRDVFNVLLPEGEEIASPLIWESTRFCVTKTAQAERSSNLLNRTTAELFLGAFEIGQKAGLISILSVYDTLMKRILDRAGCHADLVGPPQRIGKVTAYAGLFEVSDDMIDRVRMAGGITGPVLSETIPIFVEQAAA